VKIKNVNKRTYSLINVKQNAYLIIIGMTKKVTISNINSVKYPKSVPCV
jgi:hypothetical protein